ncbi:hypothetical protein JW905_07590 [bacterium]|nr:hypothetical protein [candidate division CSSED10-310 bacterium]
MAEHWDDMERLILEIAGEALSPLDLKISRKHVRGLAAAAARLEARTFHGAPVVLSPADTARVDAAVNLWRIMARDLELLAATGTAFDTLHAELNVSTSRRLRRGLMLGFLGRITPAGRMRGDAAAFRRFMEFDAVRERFERWSHRLLRRGEMAVRLLGGALKPLLASHGAALGGFLLNDLGLAAPLLTLLADGRRWQTTVAVLEAFVTMLESLPAGARSDLVNVELLRYVYRCSQDPGVNVWIQLASLKLILCLDAHAAVQLARKRILEPDSAAPEHDMFLRSGLLALFVDKAPGAGTAILEECLQVGDPSEHVRISAVGLLDRMAGATVWVHLRRVLRPGVEPSRRVRLQAVLVAHRVLRAAGREGMTPAAVTAVSDLFAAACADASPVVVRAGLELAPAAAASFRAAGMAPWLAPVETLLVRHGDERVRRWAAEAREAMLVPLLPGFRAFQAEVLPVIQGMKEGERRRLHLPEACRDDAILARLLAWAAASDLGISCRRRNGMMVVQRGDCFSRSFRRLLHELRHLSPDKRQTISHARGRRMFGVLRAPSRLMAEAIPAKAVGEPLLSPDGTWKPFLPLVDDLAGHNLFGPPVLRIASAEGITTINLPAGVFRRLRARIVLALRYGAFAAMRNEYSPSEEGNGHPLLAALRRLGFTFNFESHRDPAGAPAPVDPKVAALFEEDRS